MRELLLSIFLIRGILAEWHVGDKEEFFVYHVKNLLNKSVNPCDNFFDHVCSTAANDRGLKFYNKKYMEDLFAAMEATDRPPGLEDFVDLYSKLRDSIPTTDDKPTEGKREQVRQRIKYYCKDFKNQCQAFLNYTRDPFLGTNDNESVVDALTSKLIEFAALEDNYRPLLHAGVAHGFLSMLQREDMAALKQDFNAAQWQTEQLFRKVKAYYLEAIKKTPWVRQKNLGLYHRMVGEIANGLYVYEKRHVKFFKELYEHFKGCTDNMFGWHESELLGCFNKLYREADFPFFWGVNIFKENAGNFWDRPLIILLPSLQFPFIKDAISRLAAIGRIVAHEIGHHFVGRSTLRTPLMPEGLQCVAKHRQQVCDGSGKDKEGCWSGSGTVVEDAPDVLALAALESIFQREKDQMEMDSSLDISKEQFFYYSLVGIWCANERRNAGTHSHPRARMNGLLMHSTGFLDAFRCKPGDKMYVPPEKHCHLLGPNSY